MKNALTRIWHLGYHYIRDGYAPGLTCTPLRLREQIAALKERGYEILPCREITKRINSRLPLPERHATLSFDDGLKDHYQTAFPILKEYGVQATFFYIACALDGRLPPTIGLHILIDRLGSDRIEREVLPKMFEGTSYLDLLDAKRYDASGREMDEPPELRRIKWAFNHWPPQAFKQEKLDEIFEEYLGEGSQEQFARDWFMSGEELREMARAGMEIGSHSMTHPALDITGLADIEYELAASQRRLSEELAGTTICSLAWPFGGYFRPRARQIARHYYAAAWNFLAGCTLMPEDPYGNLTDIPRVSEQVYLARN